MKKENFDSAVFSMKVFDAHTHLVGQKLCASSFWEIVHYFWFLRELQGAGYPADPESVDEEERIGLFLNAYGKTKNTAMNYVVRRIFKDLYGIELTDRDSVIAANELVKASFDNPSWAAEVARKGNIIKTVVNNEPHSHFTGLDNVSIVAPRIDDMVHRWARGIYSADNREEAAAQTKNDINGVIKDIKTNGGRCVMTTLRRFTEKTYNNDHNFQTIDSCLIYVLHTLCGALEENCMNLQLFLGIENTWCSVAAPVNYTERILNLYGLFEKYKCKFDLVVASELNNMDVVQAAQIFPNVYVGGMWWFNFRPSTYMDAMNKRFEALASTKSYLSISDSRCIEWCYGKNTLIKKLAADFLYQKTAEGYVSYDDALDIAEDWLYNTPAALFLGDN